MGRILECKFNWGWSNGRIWASEGARMSKPSTDKTPGNAHSHKTLWQILLPRPRLDHWVYDVIALYSERERVEGGSPAP